MNRPNLFVWIVHVLILIDHRMEAVMDMTVIGEIVVSLLDEERVFRRNDSAVKDAIADRSVNVAVFVA